jgi:hypothetical protein
MINKTIHKEPLSQVIPNCWQCDHFAISWDTQRPYSCRLMGFKSKALPCLEVFNADGQVCQCFYPKVNAVPVKKSTESAASASQSNHSLGSRSWLV